MKTIEVDFKGLNSFITEEEINNMKYRLDKAHDFLVNKDGKGNEMLGWLDLATKISDEEVERIKQTAEKINKQADVFVVVGIGGSYLGSKAIIDMFTNTFSNMTEYSDRKHPEIIFVGNNLSAKYLRDVIEYLKDKDFAINVISKSRKNFRTYDCF